MWTRKDTSCTTLAWPPDRDHPLGVPIRPYVRRTRRTAHPYLLSRDIPPDKVTSSRRLWCVTGHTHPGSFGVGRVAGGGGRDPHHKVRRWSVGDIRLD